MIIRNLILSLFFLFNCISFLSSQKLEKVEANYYQTYQNEKFIYQNKVYKYSELEEIFKTNPNSYVFFRKAKKYRRNAGIFSAASGTSVIAGLMIQSRYADRNDCGSEAWWCPDWGQFAADIMFFIVAPGMLTVAITQGVWSVNRKRKAISIFNGEDDTFGFHESAQDWKLSVTNSRSGLGLTLSF